jgi:hypothetical protein
VSRNEKEKSQYTDRPEVEIRSHGKSVLVKRKIARYKSGGNRAARQRQISKFVTNSEFKNTI